MLCLSICISYVYVVDINNDMNIRCAKSWQEAKWLTGTQRKVTSSPSDNLIYNDIIRAQKYQPTLFLSTSLLCLYSKNNRHYQMTWMLMTVKIIVYFVNWIIYLVPTFCTYFVTVYEKIQFWKIEFGYLLLFINQMNLLSFSFELKHLISNIIM